MVINGSVKQADQIVRVYKDYQDAHLAWLQEKAENLRLMGFEVPAITARPSLWIPMPQPQPPLIGFFAWQTQRG